MMIKIKNKPPAEPPKEPRADYSKEASARADLHQMHQNKITADALRKKWGEQDLSMLHAWAYRKEAMP